MKKILIALAIASTSLTSCTTLGSPAPLAQTTIDEKGLVIGLETFDTLLTSIDRLRDAGVIKPGSPTAIKIADAIEVAKRGFQVAIAAQKVGNASSYLAALAQADGAIVQINSLIKG